MVGRSEFQFSCTAEVDIMFLNGRPVMNMIESATKVCAATFLRSQSSKDVWKETLLQWYIVL